MTHDDLQEVAQGVGMVKTPQGYFKPLWLASDAQLMAFAAEINKNIKQSASEYVVQAIKKAVEYEREACAKVCDAESQRARWNWENDILKNQTFWNGGEQLASSCAEAIRARGNHD